MQKIPIVPPIESLKAQAKDRARLKKILQGGQALFQQPELLEGDINIEPFGRIGARWIALLYGPPTAVQAVHASSVTANDHALRLGTLLSNSNDYFISPFALALLNPNLESVATVFGLDCETNLLYESDNVSDPATKLVCLWDGIDKIGAPTTNPKVAEVIAHILRRIQAPNDIWCQQAVTLSLRDYSFSSFEPRIDPSHPELVAHYQGIKPALLSLLKKWEELDMYRSPEKEQCIGAIKAAENWGQAIARNYVKLRTEKLAQSR